jgi:hypothetical protein
MNPHIFLLVDPKFTDIPRLFSELQLHRDQFRERLDLNRAHVLAPTSIPTMAGIVQSKHFLKIGYRFTLLTQEDTQISEEEQKQTNLLQLSYIRTNGYMDLCRIFCFVPDSRNLHPVIAATVETAKKFDIPLQVFE